MKFNIAYPPMGTMTVVETDDEKKIAAFYDKRMGQEVEGDVLGDEYKGYVFRITGGNDKQGFPMMQGVMVNHRVRLLMSKGYTHYRPRRKGERKRKSVRGCIVGSDLQVINLTVVQKGEAEVPGLTDNERPRPLFPKRANNIRKMFDLTPDADVRKHADGTLKEDAKKGRKKVFRPKIQRLVTDTVIKRKRDRIQAKKDAQAKAKAAEAEYRQLLKQRARERRESARQRRSTRASSRRAGAAPPAQP